MIVEDIQVPLIVLPQPEVMCLVRWHVPDGAHVVIGQVLFDLEIDGRVFSIESLYSGHLKILEQPGVRCRLADVIGRVLLDAVDPAKLVIGIELPIELAGNLDEWRGDVSRREFLSSLVEELLRKKR